MMVNALFQVYLYGFNSEHEEKLRKVLKGSGASRFLELSDSITHVLLGTDCDPAFSKQLKQLSYRCASKEELKVQRFERNSNFTWVF